MPQQLDIFADSSGTVLRNAAVAALLAGDPEAADAATASLAAAIPGDPLLPALTALRQALEPLPALADHAAAAAQLARFEDVVEPAAREVFAAGAATWMGERWRRLAAAAAGLDFDGGSTHAAALALRAGDWQGAAARVEGIEFWRRKPRALAWMAEARCHLGPDGFVAAWPLLIELAWLAPERFAALAARLDSTPLPALFGRYADSFDADPATPDWFPAWALIVEPWLAAGLRQTLRQSDGAAEAAARLLGELLSLERQGRQRELIEHRRRLYGLHPGLFAHYMQTR